MLLQLNPHFFEFLESQQLPGGGWPEAAGETIPRPDSTAWMILALSACGTANVACAKGRSYLQAQQASDGRISISPDHPEAPWPTALTILAWQGDAAFQEAADRAIHFLTGFTGRHFPNNAPHIVGHDTTIHGWPWIADTHSWVIPTAWALIAFHTAGRGHHARVAEGQAMLLNRQLAQGGWNYGSTKVFGRPTPPLPESTAIALQALAGHVPQHQIAPSLEYLSLELPRLKTPLSLGWSLLALGAWGAKPSHSPELILESLQFQRKFGSYSLSSLALLALANQTNGGFASALPSSFHSAIPTSSRKTKGTLRP